MIIIPFHGLWYSLKCMFFQAPPKALYIPDFISVEEESYLLDHVCKLNLWGDLFSFFCLFRFFAVVFFIDWTGEPFIARCNINKARDSVEMIIKLKGLS